ncbi:glycosyl-transferase for dystroglycan domain-containing protein [Phthorimaea operculella]|nr:glycosyl-transferase for dystroglycan domain-containing protein [Phthorimaea operculella]
MAKLRRDKIWRWRCQWTVVTLAAVALIVYNAAANVWILREPSCAHSRTAGTPIAPTISTCEPCPETPPSVYSPVDDDPLAHLDLRLGRWDASRTFRLFDYASVGDLYADSNAANRVCLATQTSIERLGELLRISAHWSGPISVAVFTAGDEFRLLRGFATWLFRCEPELYARLAIHVAMPGDKPGTSGRLPSWARACDKTPTPGTERGPDTIQWRERHPYPQNHMRNLARKNCHTPYVFLVDIDIVPSKEPFMRNLARKNCHTPYVFLVDIDIVPSKGMTEALNKFFASPPKCNLCAYVVPTYELDRRVATFPSNKSELLRLSKLQLAIAFHRKVFIYNQYASNFSRWEASGGNESSDTHVSHNVTNFELLYEPFYIAPDNVPVHDERFLGYGYTRNTQVCSCVDEESNMRKRKK